MARYIDADAARKEVVEYRVFRDSSGGTRDVYDFLDDQPTADVAPVVHGRWADLCERAKTHREAGFFCTACNFAFIRLEPKNFCPNCGAKMDLRGEV